MLICELRWSLGQVARTHLLIPVRKPGPWTYGTHGVSMPQVTCAAGHVIAAIYSYRSLSCSPGSRSRRACCGFWEGVLTGDRCRR